MRWAVVILAGAIAFSLPSSADAGGPYVDWVPTFEAAAAEVWGEQPPPCGTPQIAWVAQSVLDADHADDDYDYKVAADAHPVTCAVRFSVEEWHALLRTRPHSICMLWVHEMGHLYGHTHAEGGVMTTDVSHIEPRRYRPCARRMWMKWWVFKGKWRSGWRPNPPAIIIDIY